MYMREFGFHVITTKKSAIYPRFTLFWNTGVLSRRHYRRGYATARG